MTERGDISRRQFLGNLTIAGGSLLLNKNVGRLPRQQVNEFSSPSLIYTSRNGTPYQNMEKVIEMMGGIGNIIGLDDVVIIKPNCQWVNQGVTNISAVRQFIELILGLPDFQGEIDCLGHL